MKDSGIEWIGEIPEEWETRRIKYIASLNGRIGWQGLTSKEYCDEGAFLITGINFVNGEIDWSSCVHVPMSRWEEAVEIQVQDGDLLITKDGTIGKVAIVDNMPGNTSLNSGVLLIRSNQTCETRFLYWMLQSDIFWKWFHTINSGNSTIIHLYQYDFCNFSFPFPDIWAQKSIADYLDRKCAEIDAVIARQDAVIEKLKEYKLSLITEAVTKGLNPDAPMKDSGVEWIGQIPEHWNLVTSGFVIDRIADIDHYMPPDQDYGYAYVMTGDLKDKVSEIDFDKCKQVSKSEYMALSRKIKPEVGDVIFARYATIGTVSYVDVEQDFLVSYSCVIIRTHAQTLHGRFLYWLLKSNYFLEEVKQYINSNTQGNVGIEALYKIKVVAPPLTEQKDILAFLDYKCRAIDSTVLEKQSLIDRLTSYKKSLIYEVVTGKREVPA